MELVSYLEQSKIIATVKQECCRFLWSTGHPVHPGYGEHLQVQGRQCRSSRPHSAGAAFWWKRQGYTLLYH